MKVSVSFKDHEKDLYDYLKTKRSISVYLKDLIEADMKKNKKRPIEDNNFTNGYDF